MNFKNINIKPVPYFTYYNKNHFAINEALYYPPFGSSLPNRVWSDVSRGYRYGFNGKEKDSETANDAYDFGTRIYDGKLGRWLSVDPLAHKAHSWSTYNYAFCNPLIYIDINGFYPIYIITRSYAPFSTFGPGNNWYGDNRGHTLNKGASYRTLVSINYDTETHITSAYGGNSRSHTVDGKKDANSKTKVVNRSKDNNIDVHSYANNEAQIGSSDIDQFTKIKVTTEGETNTNHILALNGTVSGDDFPNQECMIYDSKGNTLWLGNFETSGDREWGPVTDLPLENEGDVNIKINIRIKVNKDGVFEGVLDKGIDGKEKTITIEEWNKKFKSDENK